MSTHRLCCQSVAGAGLGTVSVSMGSFPALPSFRLLLEAGLFPNDWPPAQTPASSLSKRPSMPQFGPRSVRRHSSQRRAVSPARRAASYSTDALRTHVSMRSLSYRRMAATWAAVNCGAFTRTTGDGCIRIPGDGGGGARAGAWPASCDFPCAIESDGTAMARDGLTYVPSASGIDAVV